MELSQIHNYWESLAQTHGIDLASTTKTPTIKRLEIAALSRALSTYGVDIESSNVLEIGCGNGHNLFALSDIFPKTLLAGVDYSDGMISAARRLQQASKHRDRFTFEVRDVLNMDNDSTDLHPYSIVFTDRLIINLNSWELQKIALRNIAGQVAKSGLLLILENFVGSYSAQNALREAIGLTPRTPDPYNLFLNENAFETFTKVDLGLELLAVEDFGSLHDVILYVLLPYVNSNKTNYDHPLMDAVTFLLENSADLTQQSFGSFGQNKLYVFRRPS